MKGLEWKHFKGLNELYVNKQTRLKIQTNTYISQILMKQKKLIRFKVGNHNILEALPTYAVYYEKQFKPYYEYYSKFFDEAQLENNARKTFTDEDLKALLFVYYNKEELKNKLTTETRFSANVFQKQNSKYLTNKPSLRDAILNLLGLEAFPDKEPKHNMWRIVVDCLNPEVIVLCENLDCLKVPLEYKENNVELWYVGGNNTAPLMDIPPDKLALPMYYLCDWDYAGLSIYSRVKKIMTSKGADLTLLKPLPGTKTLPVAVKHHKSKWKPVFFSGLNISDFMATHIELIENLIEQNCWIEEQNIDLIDVLKSNRYI